MPGPLPDPKSRRRNAPTIPTTQLKAKGPAVDPPDVPETYDLQTAGREWWDWAWRLPQACAWDDGALYTAARRASLEDDLLAFDDADHLSSVIDDMLAEVVAEDDPLNFKQRLLSLTLTMRKLKSLAGGRVGVMKEMRELDNKLGLNPEALAKLRWTIVDDDEAEKKPDEAKASKKKSSKRRGRLELVA